MPTLMYLGQVPAKWLTEAGDAVLSGGKIAFYEVGTTTPKEVFVDYQGITSAGTIITLNSAGRADVFLSGLYRVQLTDSNDVPIGNHIDGIGSAVSTDAANTITVETYVDLAQLDPDTTKTAVVQGRLANGDGGAGLFVFDSLSTIPDDGGAVLTPSSSPVAGRWIRVRGRYLDPRWYGCAMDATTDDTTAFAATLSASRTLQSPVLLQSGYVRLTSNTTIGTNMAVVCENNGGFYASTSAVTLYITEPQSFEGSDDCFGGSLTVRFSPNTVKGFGIAPSWWDLPSEDDQLLQAMLSTSGTGTTLTIDISVPYTLTDSLHQATTSVLAFRDRGRFYWTGAGAVHVSISQWNDESAEAAPRFTFESVAKIASLQFAYDRERALAPELFGAVGNATSDVDDSVAIYAAMLHGKVRVARSYFIGQSLTIIGNVVGADVELIGDPLIHPWDTTDSLLVLGDGIDLTFPEDLTISGVRIRRDTSTANLSAISVAGTFTADHAYLDGPSGASDSLSVTCATADIRDSQFTFCSVTASTSGKFHNSTMTGTVGAGLSGGAWSIRDSSIAKASAASFAEITKSSITIYGECSMANDAGIRSSAVGKSAGWLTVGTSLVVSDSDVSAPLIAAATSDLVFDAIPYGASIPWNGMGNATISNSLGDLGVMQQTAIKVDGVDAPSVDRAILSAEAIETTSTTGWTISSDLGTPAISDSAFYWATFAVPGFSNIAVSKFANSALVGFGGYVEAEWTGEDTRIQLELFASSSPSTAISSPVLGANLSEMGPTTQRARWHFWPGSSGLINSLKAYITKTTSGTITAPLKLKITVVPTAPQGREQWLKYWEGDRTLGGSQYHTWKETISANGVCSRVGVWVASLPSASPWTPRPESMSLITSFNGNVDIFPLASVFAPVPIVGPSSGTVLQAIKPAGSTETKLIIAGAI